MLSVILLIIKIIGIALLVLLSILILMVLAILIVPIRYRVRVEHGDSLELDAGVSWLLHLVHGRVSQSASNRRIWIRIMGILVYDSLRPPKKRKTNSNRRKAARRKAGMKHSNTDSNKNKASHIVGDKSKNINRIENSDINSNTSIDKISNDDIKNHDIVNNELKNSDIKNSDIKNNEVENNNLNNRNIEHDDEEQEEVNPGNKLVRLYKKIKLKIINFFSRIINKLKGIIHKLVNIKNKGRLILDFINDDINKSGFRFTFESLKKLLKHILPRKLESRLIFGTGDPCSTGQLLGVFAFLYSFYGDNLQITPDFENKVFKGSHYARGRIRIGTLLIIVIKLLLDKRFKDLKTNYQLLKEAL
ncbi:MAG: DUF2953 domain-containing protein [Clostridiales bacterium]|nr:DUF2953 domain-containing protein [Clostridiales bacterium]